MKQVSHYDKVMWGLYCEYSYIPSNLIYTKRYRYDWCDVLDMRVVKDSYLEKHVTRSAKQWSFIHSKYYEITKVEPIYFGTLEDFIDYLEYRCGWRNTYRKSPYNYKKNGWHFKGSAQCGKNTYRWRYKYNEEKTKYEKKPEHKKKTLTEEEIRKREWRKKVKDPRDQGAAHWKCKRKESYVTKGNRAARRSAKQKLEKSDFRYYSKSSTWWDYRLCIGHDFNGECIHEIVEWNPPKDDWDTYSDDPKRQWVNPWDWD